MTFPHSETSMNTLKEYSLILLTAMFLICSITLIDSRLQTVLSSSTTSSDGKYTVVIDAGHGGFDSGKVGIDGTLEKDVNLQIAKKLEKLFLSADVEVIMTRTDDHGLYTENSSNKKRQDMENRAALMNGARADCVISIHQNSYPEESIDGAQVFYYSGSEQGKTLASLIQKELVTDVDPDNHRIEKENSSYYLLKNADPPMVIVECGFLSNWKECKKLVDDSYQQKLVWAIHMGVLQYLNGCSP